MKASVIITTINEPTTAVKTYAGKLGQRVVVIGDVKTPKNWHHAGVDYYSVEKQRDVFPAIADALPYNHYCRKNIGYIVAAKQNVDAIVDTDDDNIPTDDWHVPARSGDFHTVQGGRGFVNVYSAFTDMQIWPRGLPLPAILARRADLRGESFGRKASLIGVWQGLANGDPDVDAIYRLVFNKPCTFEARDPLVLDEGTICPYNSQNTVTFREFFPLLYLPCSVNFRFTDILRGLIAQVILWQHGARLGFFAPTVFQDRNEHDLFRDFLDEDPCYRHPYDVIDVVETAIAPNRSVSDQLVDAYVALSAKNIICGERELPILERWLDALDRRVEE